MSRRSPAGRDRGSRWRRLGGAALVAAALVAVPCATRARAPDEPIRLVWEEGDVAGTSTIYGPDGDRPIGVIEYHQRRRGDVMSSVRVARFADGSSDEDSAEARVAGRLEAIRGRSILRDVHGQVTVDLRIDVTQGRVEGSWGTGEGRQTMDEKVALPPSTYWGPLIFVVLKNFDANADGDQVVFRTVAPAPKPRVLDLVLVRVGDEQIRRLGSTFTTRRFDLRPSIHWAIDPLIRMLVPETHFYVEPGEPPALIRFAGPRNYGGQPIRIE